MFCKNCGKELVESAKFCTKCGTKQDVKQETKEEVKQQPPVEKTEKEAKAEARVEAVAETVSKSISSAKEKISDAVKSVNNEETRAAVKETAETVSKSIDSAKEKISDAVKSINNEETKAAVKETIDATKEKVDEIGEFAEAAGQKVAGDLGAKITEKTGIKKPFKFLLPIVAVLICIGAYFGFFRNSDPFVGTWAEQGYLGSRNISICEITKNGDTYKINFYEGEYTAERLFANMEEIKEYEKNRPSHSSLIKMAKFNLGLPRAVCDYKYKWNKVHIGNELNAVRNKNILKIKFTDIIYNEKSKVLQYDVLGRNVQMVKISDDEIKKFKEMSQKNIKQQLTDEYKKYDVFYAQWHEETEKYVQAGVERFKGFKPISGSILKLGKIEFVDDVPAK